MEGNSQRATSYAFVALLLAATIWSLLVLLSTVYAPSAELLWTLLASVLVFSAALPEAAMALFLFSLPLFGNRPGSLQTYLLVVIASALTLGLFVRLLFAGRRRESMAHKNPLLFLTFVYVVVSFLSLTSLPLPQMFREAFSRLGDFSISTISTALYRFLRVSETEAAYSPLSAFHTLSAAGLAFFLYLHAEKRKRLLFFAICCIYLGHLSAILVGLCDYYGALDLSSLRALDPVVNPGGAQFRLQSFFGHSGWFAEYVTMTIPFVMLVLLLRLPYWLRAAILLALVVLGEYALLLTYQRGGWLSYPLTLVFIWFAVYITRSFEKSSRREGETDRRFDIRSAGRKALLKVVLSVPLTVLVTLSVLSFVMGENLLRGDGHAYVSQYFDRFREIARVSDRTLFLQAGFELGMLHPFLGGGSESFGYRFEREYLSHEGRLAGRLSHPLHGSAHNVFLQTFAGKGLAGLCGLLLLSALPVYFVFTAVLRPSSMAYRDKLLLLMLACFFAAFLIYGNVQEVFYVQALQYLYFSCVAICAVLCPADLGHAGLSHRRVLCWAGALCLAHFIWEFAYPGFSRTAYAQAQVYGCYGQELLPDGRPFRWCTGRTLQHFPIKTDNTGVYAELELGTMLLSGNGVSAILGVEALGEQVASVTLAPFEHYRFQIRIPQHLAARAPNNTVMLKLTTASFFIPFRDMDGWPDYRLLSYQLFESAQ